MILQWATAIAGVMLVAALALAVYRIVAGPTVPDRMVGVDTFGVAAIALLIVISLRLESRLYADAALVVAVLSFVGTAAVARFLVRGKPFGRP